MAKSWTVWTSKQIVMLINCVLKRKRICVHADTREEKALPYNKMDKL